VKRIRKTDDAQQRAEKNIKCKPATTPAKKIAPRTHNPEDLKELARHLASSGQPTSQTSTSFRRNTIALAHRTVAAECVLKGFELVNNGKFSIIKFHYITQFYRQIGRAHV